MAQITRPYRGISAEERRAARREALLAAGLDLLGTEGWTGTSVTAVCARARLTERYFYESFADREALLLTVFDRIVTGLVETMTRSVDEAPQEAAAKIRAAVVALVHGLTDDRRVGRVALLEAMGSEALQRRRLSALNVFARLIADKTQEFYGASGPPRQDVELTAYLFVGGLTELLIAWMAGSLRISRARLIDRCTAIFTAVAQIATPARERTIR